MKNMRELLCFISFVRLTAKPMHPRMVETASRMMSSVTGPIESEPNTKPEPRHEPSEISEISSAFAGVEYVA